APLRVKDALPEHGADEAGELDMLGVLKRAVIRREHVIELESEFRTPAHTQHVARRVSARHDVRRSTTQEPPRVVLKQGALPHGCASSKPSRRTGRGAG